MINPAINTELKKQEIKTVKLFLILVYTISLSFTLVNVIFVFYTSTYPLERLTEGLGYWAYFLELLLLVIAIYLIKTDKPYSVKYIYFIGFTLIYLTNDILIFLEHSPHYKNGNVAEVFIILFSPLFLNKRFFYIVSICSILKYSIIGFVAKDVQYIVAVLLCIVLSIVAFILLNRFISYLKTINEMNERIKQDEKLAVVGRVAATITHEIRNPLASLQGFIQLQKDKLEDKYYEIMQTELKRLSNIADSILFMSRKSKTEMKVYEIGKIIQYALQLVDPQIKEKNIRMESTTLDTLPKVYCDMDQIKQVLVNVLKNAVEAVKQNHGNIYLNVSTVEEKIVISIKDNGIGIPEDLLASIGEPFFTTKDNGTGLGISLSKKILKDHNGELIFSSREGEGTAVKIMLPSIQV